MFYLHVPRTHNIFLELRLFALIPFNKHLPVNHKTVNQRADSPPLGADIFAPVLTRKEF